MAQISKIKNYTLTGSFAAVEVDSDLFFGQYTALTTDGSDFDIRTDSSGSILFPVSKDLGTFPLQVDKIRKYTSDNTTIFYVKGTVDSVLSIVFWRE